MISQSQLESYLWGAATLLRGYIDAWSADPWGRNIYGTPPQGPADYAFWQHIIKKLVAHDVVECVLGLGPNLFYNPPMEACVVICRMNKPKERRNKVLFINAVNEVTRERAHSFLTDDHIQRIGAAYQAFGDDDGFARVVGNAEIREKGSNLSISLSYVRADNVNGNGNGVVAVSLKQAIADWQQSSMALRESMDGLLEALEQQTDHFRGAKERVRDQFPGTTKLIGASGGKGPRS